MNYAHTPVMLEEVITYMINDTTQSFLDCTLGEGGHSFNILKRFSNIKLTGLDRDSNIIKIAEERLSEFKNRTNLININFTDVTADT